MLKCPLCKGKLVQLDCRDKGKGLRQVHEILLECTACHTVWLTESSIVDKWPKRYLRNHFTESRDK